MFATIRRYDAIDQERTPEVVKKVDETLVPSLKRAPRLQRLLRHRGGDGILSSIGFFDTAEHANELTRVATNWVREQQLEKALPNAPRLLPARSWWRRWASSLTRKSRSHISLLERRPAQAGLLSLRLARDGLAGDRISEDDPVRRDVEFADLGLVGAAARLEDRHRAQQS